MEIKINSKTYLAEKLFNLDKTKFMSGEEYEIYSTKVAFNFKPKNADEFKNLITNSPYKLLFDMGFIKWYTLDNIKLRINEILTVQNERIAHFAKFKDYLGMFFDVTLSIMHNDEIKIMDEENFPKPQKLMEIGEEDSKTELILFPEDWYDIIPEGYLVTSIFGETFTFKKELKKNDSFGVLDFGILKKI